MSGNWDVLSLGPCLGGKARNGSEVRYKSPYLTGGPMESMGLRLEDGERVVYRANHSICLAAYALSLRGAAKLLLRTAFDLNGPVDLIINKMSERGELVVYNVVQPPFVQW